MIGYEEEMDYSEDPLVGVDIWGLQEQEASDEMVDMAPTHTISAPNMSNPTSMASCSTPIGDNLEHCSFVSPSPLTGGIWSLLVTRHATASGG